jgi:RimJ/RimL family protein N-acetyltransferase
MNDWRPPIWPEPIEFSTQRLRLRQWRDSDREAFANMNADPEVMKYYPCLVSREASDRSIDTWQREFAERGWSLWAAEIKETGEFIGYVGLTIPRHVLPLMPCVEIGWRLARAYWGRGFATEAAKVVLGVAFENLGLAEIVSFTSVLNVRSRRVMERLGMINSGEDFDHPGVPQGSELRRHCLYRLRRERWNRS